jgi:hypothetical protein
MVDEHAHPPRGGPRHSLEAPISREMMLDFVAQHTLNLGKEDAAGILRVVGIGGLSRVE